MRRNLLLALLAAVSVVFFALAATARTLESAFAFAVIGAIVPGIGLAVMALVRQRKWLHMGRDLGLRPIERGAYPDLVGRVDGKRLTVARRADIYGPGRRESTVVRWEGHPEIRLPGLVTSAETVQEILVPLDRM